MRVTSVTEDIKRICETAGLRLDTIDSPKAGEYVVTFYPLALPESDAETVRRVQMVGRTQYTYHVRPSRSNALASEELERLVFVLQSDATGREAPPF